MLLTELSPRVMNNTFINKDLNNLKSGNLNWITIQSEMKNKLGVDIYESWLKKINFVEEFKNYVLLSVSTRFIRDWITSRYLDEILRIIKEFNKNINRIELKIEEVNIENNNVSKKFLNKNENISFIKDSFLQYNRIDHNKNFENFIVGQSNKLAFEASKKEIGRAHV